MCIVLTEFKRGCMIPCSEVPDGCESPCGCWDTNLCPQEEQSVLLTIELSLKSLTLYCLLVNLP